MSGTSLNRIPLKSRFRWHWAFIALTVLVLAAGITYKLYKSLEKELILKIDGKSIEVRTFEKTVGDYIREENIVLNPADRLTPPAKTSTRDGLVIRVTRAFPVNIIDGNKTFKVMTTATDVKSILESNKITVRSQDKVFPPLSGKLSSKRVIRVIRIDYRTVTYKETIPFAIQRRSDKNMDKGKSKTLSPGKEGLLEKSVKIKLVNGQEESRVLVGTKVLVPPAPRVLAIGIRPPVGYVVTSRGTYRFRRLHNMVATAYASGGGVGTRTSTGRPVQKGVVAVDPRVIPLNSQVYVPGYGHAVAGDVGGAIKGMRIDLAFGSRREAITFGRRKVKVYVLE